MIDLKRQITIDEAIQLFDRKLVDRAIAQGLNASLEKVQTAQAAAVSRIYTVSRSAFKKTLIRRRAKPKNLQVASVSVSKVVPITIHKPIQDDRGIVVSVRRGKPKVIQGAFLALFGRGRSIERQHLGGAKRVPGSSVHQSLRKRSIHHGRTIKRGKRKGQLIKREALKQIYGATLANLADNPEVLNASAKRMAEVFPDLFQQKLKKLYEKSLL